MSQKAIGWFGFIVLLALVGFASCAKVEPTPPPFQGEPAEELIYFDLEGNWSVMRYFTQEQSADPKFDKYGRFDAAWVLHRAGDLLWADEHGQGTFALVVAGKHEYVHWHRPDDTVWWFSVNHVSFGHLQLTDENGLHYSVIRTDGGQDLPYLDRPGVTRVEKGKKKED